MAQLTRKIALVTGGGSGIGRAACQILAREGAKVIVADCNLESCYETVKLLQNVSEDHLPVHLDVSNSTSVNSVLTKIVSFYKTPPNIIVNSAGITKDNFLLKLSEKDFDDVINVNLKGTFLIIKLFANSLVESGQQGGSIINIASIVGKHGNIGQSNYSASKAAVEALTKTAAKELSKFNIRCNAILPGFINSPMVEKVPDKVKDKMVQFISMKRFGEPEEIGEVIAFLASEKSSYINGACIEVTGGY